MRCATLRGMNESEAAVRRAIRNAAEVMRSYEFESTLTDEEATLVMGVTRREQKVRCVSVFPGPRQGVVTALYLGGKLRPLLYFNATNMGNVERALRFMGAVEFYFWKYRVKAITSEPLDSDLPFSVARAKLDIANEEGMMDVIRGIEAVLSSYDLLKSQQIGGMVVGGGGASKHFKALVISECKLLRAQAEAQQARIESLETQLTEAVALIKEIAERVSK